MISQLIADLNWRYATKDFDPNKKISQEQASELCEALRLSASSFGLQLWKFLLISCQQLKKELRGHSWNQSQIEDCSHLFVLCSPITIGDEDVDHFLNYHCQIQSVERSTVGGYGKMIKGFIHKMGHQERLDWMDKQLYLALGNLLTSCAVKRIDACPIEGFSAPDYDRVLKLEEQNLRSIVVCATGFRLATDQYAGLPKVRYPMDDVLLQYQQD